MSITVRIPKTQFLRIHNHIYNFKSVNTDENYALYSIIIQLYCNTECATNDRDFYEFEAGGIMMVI